MTFTYMGAGGTPLGANDNVAGVSDYLFDFSGWVEMEGSQQIAVPYSERSVGRGDVQQPRPMQSEPYCGRAKNININVLGHFIYHISVPSRLSISLH